jgi:hypothetical protein
LPTQRHPKFFSCNTYEHPRKCCKQKTYAGSKSFICNTYEKHGGGMGAIFNIPTGKPVNLQPGLELSPLCSNSSELFCTQQKLNSLVFKQFRTLSPKTPGGWGAHPTSFFLSTFKPVNLPTRYRSPCSEQHRPLPLFLCIFPVLSSLFCVRGNCPFLPPRRAS